MGEVTTLTMGKRARLFKDLPTYIFDYPFALQNRIFTTPTLNNLTQLQELYGFKYDKVYVTRVGGSERYSYFVTGFSKSGKPFIFSRKETAGLQSGQTKVYSELGNVPATSLLRSIPQGRVPDVQKNLSSLGLN